MTKKLIWRLREQPTSKSLQELVATGLLTKEEAREILFSEENQENRNNESLKSEIKFLKELVEKLASRNQIVETIKIVESPWKKYDWYRPYKFWYEDNFTFSGTDINLYTTTGGNGSITSTADSARFSTIGN